MIRNLIDSPSALVLLWGAPALLALAVFALRPRRILLASDDGGSLKISRHALHKLIEACCEQTRGIASARARVKGSPGRLSTRVKLKIRPDAKLDVIQSYLTQEIDGIFRQNLGVANDGPIEIEVTGVAPYEVAALPNSKFQIPNPK